MHNINHLYWRAGFGLSAEEWLQKKDWTIEKAINDLFNQAQQEFNPLEAISPIPEGMTQLSPELKKELPKKGRETLIENSILWLNRMSDPNNSALRERMCVFWHGHFACRPRFGYLAAQYLNIIQQHALGNFRDLLLGIARDPAMIRYLNNQQNRKLKPNENFARELLELFTMGRGNYTESDIKEAAKAFTGWSSDIRGNYIFRARVHDNGPKNFFGQTGNLSGEDIIDIILEKRTTAKFITRKIYRYFVNQEPDETIIEMLANRFYEKNYDIEDLMKTIFSSDWFYEDRNIGTKIKSPIDLIIGLKKALSIEFQEPKRSIGVLRALGQVPFNPPNVAGWPGGESWIDNSTLMLRLNLPAGLINKKEVRYRPKDDLTASSRGKKLSRFATTVNFSPIERIIDDEERAYPILEDWLLLSKPQLSKEQMTTIATRYPNLEPSQALVLLTMSLPEYQMC